MRKTLIVVVAGALALAAAAAGAHPQNPADPHGTVYVTERGATPGTAAAFDAATGRVLWKTDVGHAAHRHRAPARHREGLHVRRGLQPDDRARTPAPAR